MYLIKSWLHFLTWMKKSSVPYKQQVKQNKVRGTQDELCNVDEVEGRDDGKKDNCEANLVQHSF